MTFRVLGCENRDYFTTSGANHFVTLIKVQKMFNCHITGEISTFSEDKLLRKHLILDSILHRNYVEYLNYKFSQEFLLDLELYF